MKYFFCFICIFISNFSFAKTELCELNRASTNVQTLELSICLIRSDPGPEIYQGVRRRYKNIGQQPITLFIENHELYRFELNIRQGKSGGLVERRKIWAGDMDESERAEYVPTVLAPVQSVTFIIAFSKFKTLMPKEKRVNLDSPFSMYFRFLPTFLRNGEQGGWLEALKLRTAEQAQKRDFPAQIEYKNILIRWD